MSRFTRAPRLILTVITIGIAQLLAGVSSFLSRSVFSDLNGVGGQIQLPFRDAQITVTLGGPATVFHTGQIALVVVAILGCGGLLLFMWRSGVGIAIRGSSEDSQRAETLGINVAALTGLVWLAAGFLSAMAGTLGVIAGQAAPSAGLSVTGMVRILAVVVFARLVSLPLAVIAAFLLGVVDQGMFWNFSNETPFEGLLFIMVAGALLLQVYRSSRAEQEATAAYLAAKEARPIPVELRGVPVVESGIRWAGIVAAIAILGYPFVITPRDVNLGSVVMIYAMVGLSLLILTGWAGQISLGQWGFVAIGGYVASMLRVKLGLDIVLCIVGAAAAGAVASVIIGLPALRLRGLHLAITSLAFALATTSIILSPSYLGKDLPTNLDRPIFLGLDLNNEPIFFYFTLVFLVITIIAVLGLRRSRTARTLIASRDNEPAAQSFGINMIAVRLSAFALSGFIAAAAGGIFAFHQHGVKISGYGPDVSVTVFLMVVIGGLGSVAGPILGAIYQGLLIIVSNPVIGFIATGGGVVAVLLFFPGGLSAVAYSARDTMLRRVAIRYRITVPSLLADVRRDGRFVKAPIEPKTRAGGGEVFVPERYRLKAKEG